MPDSLPETTIDAGDTDWSEINAELEAPDELPEEEEEEVIAPKGVPNEPAETTAPAETEAVPAETSAATTPVVEETPAVAATPVEAPVAMTPEARAQWEAQHLERLEKAYAMDEEMAQAFQTEPELVLPKMAAKMHMDITRDVMAGVQAIFPQLLQQINSQQSLESQSRNEFFSVNSDLNKPEYEDAIQKVGQMFRQVNPKASKAEAIERIGVLTRSALGLPPLQTTPAEQQKAQPKPLAAVRPFTPARGGGAAPAVKTQNVWEEFASDEDGGL